MIKKNTKINQSIYIGSVDHISSEYAFIIVKELDKDILVPHIYLRGAMHQDTVQVVVTRRYPKFEGRVIEVIKRNTTTLVGRINLETQTPIFLPDNRKINYFITLKRSPSFKWDDKNKFALTITQYPSLLAPLVGQITEVLGPIGSHKAETASLITQFKLSSSFEPAIEEKVAQSKTTTC